jgi:hypothetical protein
MSGWWNPRTPTSAPNRTTWVRPEGYTWQDEGDHAFAFTIVVHPKNRSDLNEVALSEQVEREILKVLAAANLLATIEPLDVREPA